MLSEEQEKQMKEEINCKITDIGGALDNLNSIWDGNTTNNISSHDIKAATENICKMIANIFEECYCLAGVKIGGSLPTILENIIHRKLHDVILEKTQKFDDGSSTCRWLWIWLQSSSTIHRPLRGIMETYLENLHRIKCYTCVSGNSREVNRSQKEYARLVNGLAVDFQAEVEKIEIRKNSAPETVSPIIDEIIEETRDGLTKAEINIITDPRGMV